MKRIIKSWLLPILAAGLIFALVRPTFAQIIERQARLAEYVVGGDVGVGSEVIKGYHQVFYLFEGEKTFITPGNQNSTLPDSDGEWIVYRQSISGVDQIFLYNLLTGTTLQLTHSSNNTNPQVSQGKVVWERWIKDRWQIFLFDGTKVEQLTSGDLSVNPEIEGDNIIYGRRSIAGWRAVAYSIKKNEAVGVTFGQGTKKPKLRNGKVILTSSEGEDEEFPLIIADLFLLDLPPLSPEDAPLTVSEEEIKQELESVSAAATEMPAASEASPSGQIE